MIADVLNTNFYNAKARGVKLFFEETENIPFTLIGDKVRMTQVCNNLVSNAVKFAKLNTDAYIKASYISETKQLEISVQGKSIKILAEDQINLFKPYAHISNNSAYTGKRLGLFISKQITDQLGGTIGYKQTLTGKTKFFFTVPCYPAAN